MKRFQLLIVLLLQYVMLTATPVSREDLISYASIFVKQTFPGNIQYSVLEISPLTPENQQTLHYINLSPEGWLLVSADDRVTPVLGFSFTGRFDANIAGDLNVSQWIRGYCKVIEHILAEKSLKRNMLWDGTDQLNKLKSAVAITVDPLIQVNWNQDAGWNRFCPEDEAGPGGHAYCGCVGVSMAQAMSVYQYPLKGKGTYSYSHPDYGSIIVHFDSEPEYAWDSMAVDTPDNHNARLLYHTAVTVSMNFGPDASGSFTSRIPKALINYFGYYKSAKRVARYANLDEWIQLLGNELLAGRPVIYSGDGDNGEPGHAFDIDGVTNDRYFHINWGWSGKYNGYFTLNNLNPGSNDFSAHHEAVINIRPPVYSPTDLDLSETTVKEGMPAGTYVGRLNITDEATDNEYVIRVKGDSVGGNTYLDPDFYMSHDSLKTDKEFLFSEKDAYIIYIEVEDKFGHVYQEKFTITILEDTAVSASSTRVEPVIEIYPNPASGWLIIKNPFPGGFTVEMTDLQGRQVMSLKSDDPEHILQVSHIIPGLYFLSITPESGNPVTRKVIIR